MVRQSIYKSQVDNCVKGNLAKHIDFWENVLNAKEHILECIRSGYSIPFINIPSPCHYKNNCSAILNSNFVDSEITSLLDKGIIIDYGTTAPTIVNPLTVSTNASGKKRLILDLRWVNKHIEKFKFKLEGMQKAVEYVNQGDFAFKFDLKSGYHHLDINPLHYQYLGFSWRNNFYVFSCLPFGMSSAPFQFTQLLKPLVKYWRSKGFRIVVYLDDGFGISNCYESCFRVSREVRNDLVSAGFIPNEEKSCWNPTQKILWLGFSWDLVEGTLNIPVEKIVQLKNKIVEGIHNPSLFTSRFLASIAGKIISFQPSLGNICSIMSRFMHMIIANSSSWDQKIVISNELCNELEFWLKNLESLPLKSFLRKETLPERMIYTDASGFAGAGYIVELSNSVVHKMWNDIEKSKSSTWRELTAVNLTLRSCIHELKNKTIKLYTDNQNVVKIIKAGSMKLDLHELALDIFSLCIRNRMSLDIEWVPRDENSIADSFSKLFDFDDWSVSENIFQFFNAKWGPYDIDIFADYNNFKVEKFYSKFWCPNTSGVDAFAFDWSSMNCWLVPPINLVIRTIQHMKLCKCLGTLIVPRWPSSHFWPYLVSVNGSFESFIKHYVEYSKPRNFFVAGSDKNSVFAQEKFLSNVLVLRIDFSV
jgi:ribonuclease HI